jgi:hypothetical protein
MNSTRHLNHMSIMPLALTVMVGPGANAEIPMRHHHDGWLGGNAIQSIDFLERMSSVRSETKHYHEAQHHSTACIDNLNGGT